ncbi:hypothetical protein [Hymenobacter cellulosivorans]|uniref:Recombinase n=1 Tax=Hymenobacter cellulosivorans TaxID=2932249 RepID=A0ABY4F982_9BACT|nr:hypothetical protein [Hymenobacter cellulosivorans]UOQ53083.1 hypothetical protein MUN80_25515 [Hymenobacter cellulosivorans]
MNEAIKTSAAVTRTPGKALAPNLKTPDSSLTVAADLARFIQENKLSSNIQGKEYVNVEGWQFAGSRLGIIPRMGLVEDLSNGTEIRFRATVSLYDLHNKIELGGGVAECSNKERTKKFYESYAICSMAQTRAVGKAYRNVLAWLIKAAGFEATPYEEMTDVVDAGTSAEVVEAAPAARPTQPAAAPVATPPASTTVVAPAAPAPSGEPELVVRASEEDIQKLEQLIASPLLDAEERTKLLSKPIDQRSAKWVADTLSKLIVEIGLRADPKKALEAARKQLRTAAAKYSKEMGEHEYNRLMQRAQALTAKPEELRAEARQCQTQFQVAA